MLNKTVAHPIVLDKNYLSELYKILAEDSPFSDEVIEKEVNWLVRNAELGQYFFSDLSVNILAYLIRNNIAQEAATGAVNGRYHDINVQHKMEDKHLFLISDNPILQKQTMDKIKDLLHDNPDKKYRLSYYRIVANKETEDIRHFYVFGEEEAKPKEQAMLINASQYIQAELQKIGKAGRNIPQTSIEDFINSASNKFVETGLYYRQGRTIENYISSWAELKSKFQQQQEDILIKIDPQLTKSGLIEERRVQLWVAKEKFQSNYEAVNKIFERKGLTINRQYFETFELNGQSFIALSTYVRAKVLTPEMEKYLQNELYNRCLLMKDAPLSAGEVESILDLIKTGKDHEKLTLLEEMQANKRKEYLIALVYLLKENRIIRERAFGLLKQYLLNPTPEMKDDYYWSTLMNIFSAATMPIDRGNGQTAKPLTDNELIQLIKFRDIYYETFIEPLTGEEYLFIRINGEGIGKGGIRMSRDHVSFSGEGALATNMAFKTMGLGIPKYTTAKGGILGGKSHKDLPPEEREQSLRNVLQTYADFLYYKANVGPLSDVPAGDLGINAKEIMIFAERITDNAWRDCQKLAANGITVDFNAARILKENFGINIKDKDLLKKLAANRSLVEGYTAGAITGKTGNKGLPLRTGATGKGLKEVLSAQQNYQDFNDASLWRDPKRVAEAITKDKIYDQNSAEKIKMLTFAIQGFGKVGAWTAVILAKLGAKITMVSDASGTLQNDQGIPNIIEIFELWKKSEGKMLLADLSDEQLGQSKFIPGNTMLPLKAPVDAVIPAALEEVITNNIKPDNKHIFVRDFDAEYEFQGGNGPTTFNAEIILLEMGKISFPDILTNSGGVLASYLEWLNGLIQQFGYAKIYNFGFVHPIVHNLILHYYPQVLTSDLQEIDSQVYDFAFKFTLRWATIETIRLSRKYKISMRTAYTALGMSFAAQEGRLTDNFTIETEKLRDTFAGR
jgi:glutamate dehydrogenase/leucine dehydrogenase